MIDGTTRVYAVLADPIAQVQTPRLANPLFEAAGRNIRAVPFHVPADTFEPVWHALVRIPSLAGIGVSIPHKIAAARLCDTLTPVARAVGTVNSIQRDEDGRMHGALFDGIGFLDGLAGQSVSGRRVLLVGAGGAGRTIAHALAEAGVARLTILDPDAGAVRATRAILSGAAPGLRVETAKAGCAVADHDMLINASPVGVHGADPFPVSLSDLSPSVLVADIAALSRETELLRHARAIGCPTADGNDMLLAQIALIAGFAAGLPAGEPLRRRS